MAQEYGKVNSKREAYMRMRFSESITLECVIDTGFIGALVLPRSVVNELQLHILGRLTFDMVGGASMAAEVAGIEVDWLGQKRTIQVVVSEAEDALFGTELLDDARLTIDYIENTVTLTNETEAK